jgi:UDP-2,3-diacylglucosamine pyrophosphatase LpxH
MINSMVNWVSEKLLRKGKVSLSKRVKNSVKSAIKFIDDFEQTAIDIAIENEYDFVLCGHIHQPAFREVETDKGKTTYLNSGDWIENLTALEYENKAWSLYRHPEQNDEEPFEEEELSVQLPNMEVLYQTIVQMPHVAFSSSKPI